MVSTTHEFCSSLIPISVPKHILLRFWSSEAVELRSCPLLLPLPYDLQVMANIISSHSHKLPFQIFENPPRCISNKAACFGHSVFLHSSGGTLFSEGNVSTRYPVFTKDRSSLLRAVTNGDRAGNVGDDDEGKENGPKGSGEANSRLSRDELERLIGKDDSSFSGLDLATLIRKKYGRSYDVQLIKKEFMGKNLLALNVMWKYREQRSFPLTEEEYILRLDDVANTLKCWGAVSHIRNSLEKSKDRPRIGKAVSIFIDMDESGGRSNEWIYK